MKLKKIIMHNTLLILIIAMLLIVYSYGQVLIANGYATLNEGEKTNPIKLGFLKISEGVYPWNVTYDPYGLLAANDFVENNEAFFDEGIENRIGIAELKKMDVINGPGLYLTFTKPAIEDRDAIVEEFVRTNVEETKKPDEQNVQESISENEVSENSISDNAIEEELPKYSFGPVTDEYFEDVLIIGDSRTEGLYQYGRIETATYYAKQSMNIYNMMSVRLSTSDVDSVRDGLMNNQFGKIYIMLGVNELGIGDTDYYIDHFKAVLDEIRAYQPEAKIVIQSIMHVTGSLNNRDKYFNNAVINERNAALAELADDDMIFYMDLNSIYDDENGNLKSEYSGDEVHLYAKHYDLWKQFLYDNGLYYDGEPYCYTSVSDNTIITDEQQNGD